MRPPLAAVLMLTITGLGGLAHGAEFDEKLKAPMMKNAEDFQTQAQSFATKFRTVRDAEPAQTVTDASLARQQFDMSWQLERAVNERRPLSEPGALGLISLENGGYRIDTRENPQWRAQGEYIATMFKSNVREGTFKELLERGFRPEDIEALRTYIGSHDVDAASRTAMQSVARAFRGVVRKFDKAARPVPHALVLSYWYQSGRAYHEANRAWSEGLLKSIDAQRQRVLNSYLAELVSFKSVTPESVEEGVRQTLESIRSADLDQESPISEGVVP
jgi:hypothetical protein